MPTFKVVVIGASGVGKTSLRGQYISARFSSSYRATIGADFITKTLPPISLNGAPVAPDAEPITLQIWDTAGQERFSSLASAFFRGADAAILMYDVTAPPTLAALTKWWGEFRDKAPLADADVRDFCVVVVGNKVDLLEGLDVDGTGSGVDSNADAVEVVTAAQGARFVRALVPRPDTPPSSPGPSGHLELEGSPPPSPFSDYDDADAALDDPLASSELTARPISPSSLPPLSASTPVASILRHPHLAGTPKALRKTASQVSFRTSDVPHPQGVNNLRIGNRTSRSLSRDSRRASTVTSTLTIYHTPSSSVFSASASEYASGSEYYHSAQSSYSYSDSDAEYGSSPGANGANGFASSPAANGVNGNARLHGGMGIGVNGVATRSPSEVTITPARFSASNSAGDLSLNSPTSPSPSPRSGANGRSSNRNSHSASNSNSSSDASDASTDVTSPASSNGATAGSTAISATADSPSTNGTKRKIKPPSPPPIDTNPMPFTPSPFASFSSNGGPNPAANGPFARKSFNREGGEKTAAERAADACPSSAALSPLPYPEHWPGAAHFGSLGNGGSFNGGGSAFSSYGARGIPGGIGNGRGQVSGASAFAVPSGPAAATIAVTPPADTTVFIASGSATEAAASLAKTSQSSLSSTVGKGKGKGKVPALPAPLPNGSTPNGVHTTPNGEPHWLAEPDLPSTLSNVGAAHFRTSARTGEGVPEVFGWVARRLTYLHAKQQRTLEYEGDPRMSLANGKGGAEERLRVRVGKDAGKEGKAGCC